MPSCRPKVVNTNAYSYATLTTGTYKKDDFNIYLCYITSATNYRRLTWGWDKYIGSQGNC